MKQKRTITIEFEQVRITTSHSSKKTAWCEGCRTESEFVDQTGATEIALAMQQQGLAIRNETLHFNRQNQLETLVCLNSILTDSTDVIGDDATNQ